MKNIWLVQLGSPEAPTRAKVKEYLDEFLMDSRMIAAPRPLRDVIVKGLITPFRSAKSAEAYRSVWMKEGSPLMVHTHNLVQKLKVRLEGRANVFLSVRYGQPNLRTTWAEIQKCGADPTILLPLFPQYAASTQASIFDQVFQILKDEWCIPHLQVVPSFYRHPAFIRAFAEMGRRLRVAERDAILFSFHGLPESYVAQCGTRCQFNSNCCGQIDSSNLFCYRAQCYATANAIQNALQLDSKKCFVSFQSRLKGQKWIEPYTDHWLRENAKRYPRVAVFSPSFVADCLETLEEIQIRENESFKAAGGQELSLVPSLNSEEVWLDALVEILEPYLKIA